jgi:hypothetical protein
MSDSRSETAPAFISVHWFMQVSRLLGNKPGMQIWSVTSMLKTTGRSEPGLPTQGRNAESDVADDCILDLHRLFGTRMREDLDPIE